ncbi:MAG: hypothetical protein ABIF10_05995 [Candidatus Woesearchaeota archaeon]
MDKYLFRDGTCNVQENFVNCQQDCNLNIQSCGDNVCNGNETYLTCAEDCTCGDGICGIGENCTSCEEDCGICAICGNGACDQAESCSSCAADCGICAICGDNECNGMETCNTCSIDCGTCIVCEDAICSNGENCENCQSDCGTCRSSGGGGGGGAISTLKRNASTPNETQKTNEAQNKEKNAQNALTGQIESPTKGLIGKTTGKVILEQMKQEEPVMINQGNQQLTKTNLIFYALIAAMTAIAYKSSGRAKQFDKLGSR